MVGGLVVVLVVGLLAVTVKPDEDQDSNKISMCELSLAQLLLLPPDSIQVQALRREFFQYLEDKLEQEDVSKRSFVSLIRDGNLPYVPKRSLEAFIRAGYIKPDELEDELSFNDDYNKRSIANLAKNGQLPNFQKQDDKRGIESLARNGELLHGKRKLETLLQELYDKRNVGSLARGFNFPIAGKRYLGALARTGDLRYSQPNDRNDNYDKRNIASIVRNGKRSISSLVRTNNLPSRRYLFDEMKRNIASIARMSPTKFNEKRAVPTAALLRQTSYKAGESHPDDDDPQHSKQSDENNENSTDDKRNLASLKAQLKSKFKRSIQENETASRSKRQADYWEPSEEYPVPVYQNNNVYDYEELMHELTGEYPVQEKRFLGSVARTGWFRPTSANRFRPSKRHIGALARLGWLPAFRSARRYNRSGRSLQRDRQDQERSNTSDGTPKVDTEFQEDTLGPVESERYLLPAVDNLLLRKLLTRPSQQDTL